MGTRSTQNSIGYTEQITEKTTKRTANKESNEMNNRKETAVGQSKSKLSQKINKLSCHTIIEEDIPQDQRLGAAATTKEDKLVPPLLDNGEGKQQALLVIDHKSNIDKCNDKEEQRSKPTSNDMTSVYKQYKSWWQRQMIKSAPLSNVAKLTVDPRHPHCKVQQHQSKGLAPQLPNHKRTRSQIM